MEKSISSIAISPSGVSKVLAKGSVLYNRKPLDVPAGRVRLAKATSLGPLTDSQTAVILIEVYEVQSHGE